ncbi:MAG: glycosyltransferase family 2 protein [Planctomycetes bacterium]|nr:glycosyltransferase family 2 protein [Planctomycetota bacterium]
MGSSRPRVSVVCPAFEEEACLPHFHAALAAVLDSLAHAYDAEIIYVDDGSRDRTLDVVKSLARQDSRVRFLSFSRNFGQQAALSAGLEVAGGDAIITMDSDLQHPPELIPQLLEQWRDGHDVVLTIRADDKRLGLGKRLTSKLFYSVMRRLSETDVRPARSDYRLLSRKVAGVLARMNERQRFLRGLVQWLGFSVAEVPFHPNSRKAGASKYSFRSLLRLAGDGIFSFSAIPLRLPYYLGAACFGVGLLATVMVLARCLWSGDWTIGIGWAVLVAMHLIGGCLLVALGVLGEYVGRIYEQVKQRPLYVLKDQSPEFALPARIEQRNAA